MVEGFDSIGADILALLLRLATGEESIVSIVSKTSEDVPLVIYHRSELCSGQSFRGKTMMALDVLLGLVGALRLLWLGFLALSKKDLW
jgi:hypothetical protein